MLVLGCQLLQSLLGIRGKSISVSGIIDEVADYADIRVMEDVDPNYRKVKRKAFPLTGRGGP
jgi:hypothetical protein